MSHQSTPTQTIADIYKGVIGDVIAQVKEAFLDENVDVDVLHQLKKDWEDKVRQSNAVDMDGPRQQGPPPIRSGQMPLPARPMPVPVPAGVRLQHSTQQILQQQQQQQHHLLSHQMEQQQQRHPQPQQMQFTLQPGQRLQTIPVQNMAGMQQVQFAHGLPPGVRMVAQAPTQGQQFVLSHAVGGQQLHHLGQPVMIVGGPGPNLIANNGMLQQVQQHQQRVVAQQQQQHQQQQSHHQDQHPVHQLDGGSSLDTASDEPEDTPCSSGVSMVPLYSLKNLPKPTRVKGKELKELLKRFSDVIQLDGNGMSDSSSEDEAEEDDDPYRRIADRIGDGNVDDEEEQNEEAPLNSEDDQTDDEDLSTLFDADNVVMCQFEKVHRARQKWKFSLKDGIMHIDGKDYCFQKCSGEAEW